MMTIGQGTARTCSGVSRRDFLRAGSVGLGSFGLMLPELAARTPTGGGGHARSVILLLLVGGPSQLETWDPKPDAPEEVRGPFGCIPTRVPGLRISEHLPRMAARMDRVALVRSMHHDSAPIHETGLQLLQTGRLSEKGEPEAPHLGSVAASLIGPGAGGLPPSMIVPSPIQHTGVRISRGQSAGWLGEHLEPFRLDADPASAAYDPATILDRARRSAAAMLSGPEASAPGIAHAAALLETPARDAFDLNDERGRLRDAYGRSTFGQSCLLARRLVERGVRLVTVNMFDTVFNRTSWDCHGSSPFSTLDDYARDLLPTLDRALSTLLDDLGSRGLLETTTVVATGEFGRTPRLNAAGGRDHWPGVWSALLAGGGIPGGAVLGASDAHASAPADRPVTPGELLATMYRGLGLAPHTCILGHTGEPHRPAGGAEPIRELLS